MKNTKGWGAFCHLNDNLIMKGGIMQCPNCGGDMWDNRENKKNPKSPDYKCKDTACGHPIWLKKEVAKNDELMQKSAKPNNGINTNAMLLSYAKDIVVALIEKGLESADPIAQIEEYYKKLKVML